MRDLPIPDPMEPRSETQLAVQDEHAPTSICYGCGPSNPKGLQIKSHWEGDPLDGGVLRATFLPEEHHQAFPGVINGGILGTLLDCHSNWCAATALMHHNGWDRAQCTVTADFHVKLRRPTPHGVELQLEARVVEIQGDDRCLVEATVIADGKTTATCTGTFVAVKEGHPAYHRWG
jgi:acyl-coenzyme A thioesterase PaaI-like protein